MPNRVTFDLARHAHHCVTVVSQAAGNDPFFVLVEVVPLQEPAKTTQTPAQMCAGSEVP